MINNIHEVTSMKLQGFKMQDFFLLISDGGNALASKFINFFGISVGLGGGAVQMVAAKMPANPIIEACVQASPHWLAYIPAVAAITLSVKHIADMYYTYKDRNPK